MSERINHVADAIACEEAGLSIMRQHTSAPHMEAVMQFDLARLHAQLALVEQQRIANVLALAALTNPDGSRVAPWAATYPDGDGVQVDDEIREGLGL